MVKSSTLSNGALSVHCSDWIILRVSRGALGRWNDTETKPSMLLLTTLNSTILGGGVTLSSTDSPRLFIDSNVCVTEKYLSRCGADGDATPAIKNSSTVIKSCDEPYAIYWFEVKVCDDGGDEETFVSFDKTALKLTTTKIQLQDLKSVLSSPILRQLISLQLQKKKMIHCTVFFGNYNNRTYLCSLNCSHTFHFCCIGQWLRTNISCPI
ncbi:hypothetical protein Bca4012_027520 [Brassica carinata]